MSWQDLGLCIEDPKHLLRASRKVWAQGHVLDKSPVLSSPIRSGSTSVLGLWQLYLAMVLLNISWIRNRHSHCPLPADQPGHGSAAGHQYLRAPTSPGAVLKRKAFSQGGLTFSLGSLETCITATTC